MNQCRIDNESDNVELLFEQPTNSIRNYTFVNEN